jgi:hypothetical protein
MAKKNAQADINNNKNKQANKQKPLIFTKGETITRVNGDVSINCSKR